jgi:homoserine dehydrogenase
VHDGELLADVDSEFNAIILEGPTFNQLTFLGKGAGRLPTASAVLNDIVRIGRTPTAGSLPGFLKAAPAVIAADAEAPQCHFVRVATKPGAREAVLDAVRVHGVAVLKHATVDVAGSEFLGVITDTIPLRRVNALMDALKSCPGVAGTPASIRLDKDNYRDIVERQQTEYFGSSLKRQRGAGV